MKAIIKDGKLIVTGSFTGKRPWAAKVLGIDVERGFERQFIGVRCVPGGDGAGSDMASVALPLVDGEVFELGAWEFDGDHEKRAFFRVEKGRPVKISREECCAHFDTGSDECIDLPF